MRQRQRTVVNGVDSKAPVAILISRSLQLMTASICGVVAPTDVLLKAVREEQHNATDDVQIERASAVAVPPCDPRSA